MFLNIENILTFLLFLHTTKSAESQKTLQDPQCLYPQTTGMKLVMTTRRNQTGHRIAQVRLEHSSENRAPEDRETGMWTVDVDHDSVMCEGTETVSMVATVTAPPSRPGPDYELVPVLGYYKLHTTAKTWEDARKICAQEGAHLAVLNSELEVKELKQIFTRNTKMTDASHNDYAFIGVNDIVKEGQFMTIFGVPLVTNANVKWMAGRPNNGGNINTVPGQDCVAVFRNDMTMNDLPCTWKLAFFCEQEL